MDAKANRNQIWTYAEIIADKTPRPPAVIEGGILNVQSMLMIVGKPKANKSFLAMNMAIAIAAGRPFACFHIGAPHKVLLLSAEGGYYSNRDRLSKMVGNIMIPSDDFLQLSFDARWQLDSDDDLRQLASIIDTMRPDVVILDPFVKFHTAEENSAQEMSDILNRIRKLIEEKNVSVILVHHLGKAEGNGARGSSAILGEYDSCITIVKGNGKHQLSFDLRHAESPDNVDIKFNPETFWFEECSNTSPIISILQEHGEMPRKALKELVAKNKPCEIGTADNNITKELKKGTIEYHNKMIRLK